MNQWWAGLAAREKRLVVIGGLALIITLLYVLLLEPFFKKEQELQEAIVVQNELLTWMQDSEQKIRILRGQAGSGNRPTSSGSLLALVDQTAKRGNLGSAIKRVEPEGNEGVRLWLEEAAFDNILRWLAKIKQTQGVEVSRVTIEQPDTPGIVNARISLKRGDQ